RDRAARGDPGGGREVARSTCNEMVSRGVPLNTRLDPMRSFLTLLTTLAVAAAAGAASHARAAETFGFPPFLRSSAVVHLAAPRSAPGKLYIVQQDRRIRLAVKGRLLAKPFLDIRSLVTSGGERGLLSIAFHPGFVRNRLFYVNFTGI